MLVVAAVAQVVVASVVVVELDYVCSVETGFQLDVMG